MEGAKFCPVAKADCRKEQCAWWDKYLSECAVLSIMFALWADVDEDEDEEDEAEESGEEGTKEFRVKIKRME
ncbi:hypothetical protein [Pelotomaculum propionicicum]|uniref:Uncharacterized protein n=1 Tax=Pelotomaculum propionicicum TaxID=258475 RepID=A0A4Y7RUP3_9FIRM|nr:hypothetical protein [Pelotomaculum propionicicum]TEB12708.1 hypothetical protein Pmgp_00679 [Pelotomaculum propionicicum]